MLLFKVCISTFPVGWLRSLCGGQMVAEPMWWSGGCGAYVVVEYENNANSAFNLVGVEVEVEAKLGKMTSFNGYLREAFKRKNRKYIGLLPKWGGGYPPTNIFPVFS